MRLALRDQFVATSSDDGTLRVWEADNGSVVATYPVQKSDDTTIAFSASGHTLLVAGQGILEEIPCDVCLSFDRLLSLAEHRAFGSLTSQERHEFLDQ